MAYLLFVTYLILFSWLVTRIRFFNQTGLSKPQLVIIFLLKVIAGIFYGWMGNYYGGFAQMIDTWNYHHNGLLEYQLLAKDPADYLTNLFYDPYHHDGLSGFFSSKDSYWNDLKSNVFIKILSIFDIFSFGHYYINVIFYAFISLFGPMAIYRVMADVFPAQKRIILFTTFFIPSFFYWSSGIHKEGLIFTGIALVIFHIYFGNKENKLGVKRWLGVLLGLFILFLLRNFILVIILPAILAWLLANRWPKYGLSCFTAVYLFCSIAFFTLRYIDPRLDFPQAVVTKQQAFIDIVGTSSIPIKQLRPDVLSFLENTPQAITLSAVRPYPSDVRHLLSLAAAVETEMILLLFLLFLFFRRKNKIDSKNVLYFCIFISFSVLLAIGFSVNNLGAIVRYRSIIIPLLIGIMAAQTDWKTIADFFTGKNKKESCNDRNMTHYTEILKAAWKGYDSSRTIKTIEDISPMVSTNHVYKVTFTDEDFIIAKLSTFGEYEHFKEDHRIIHSLGNNLLYPFENLLAKSLLKNNRVYTYRHRKGKTDAWVVFYNPSRVMQFMPRRLQEGHIRNFGKQIGKFHLACSRIRNVLPKSSKTLRTDINSLLDQLETDEKRFGNKEHISLIKHHCEQFLKNRNKCNAGSFETIPVFIDWNIGNFSVVDNFELFSRWDYDWFRMSSRTLDFYFFSRVVSEAGDKTVWSYLIGPMMDDRFLIFLSEYHKINPLIADEIRFLREVYRFFILNYVIRNGIYFFSEQYAKKLYTEAIEIYLPSVDRDFDPEKIIDHLKIRD